MQLQARASGEGECGSIALEALTGLTQEQIQEVAQRYGYRGVIRSMSVQDFFAIAQDVGLKQKRMVVPGKAKWKDYQASAEQFAKDYSQGNWSIVAKGRPAHIMAMTNGRLYNKCGYGDESVQLAIEWSRGAKRSLAHRVVARYLDYRGAAIRADRDYCICLPKDKLLYVEVPTGEHLVNLLLTGRFRGQAHFRTSQGYAPYSGGGVAFPFKLLLMRGVKPIWYPQGDRDTAIAQLIEDGVYTDEREAQRHSAQIGYAGECEWMGPAGMRFDPAWATYAWYNPRKPPSEESLAAIHAALPSLDLRTDAPESGSSPCKAAARVVARYLTGKAR